MYNNHLHQLQLQQHLGQYPLVIPHRHIPLLHAQPPPPAAQSLASHMHYSHQPLHGHQSARLVPAAARAPPAPHLRPPGSATHLRPPGSAPHDHQSARLVPAAARAPPAPQLRPPGSATHLRPLGSAPAHLLPPAMMGGAMYMQRMHMAGFSMTEGPQFAQFFMAGVRQSILGQPRHAAPVRGGNASFTPNRYPCTHTSSTKQDSSVRLAESRRDGENTAVKSTDGLGSAFTTEGEVGASGEAEAVGESVQTGSQHEEPTPKRQKTNGYGESGGGSPLEGSGQTTVDGTCSENNSDSPENEAMTPSSLKAGDCVEETRATEVLGVGSSLKVTIQQTSESRAFSTGLGEPDNHSQGSDQHSTPSGFICYICDSTCSSQQDFQSHMNSLQHQRRLMEIQHMSSACLAKLLPSLTDHREKMPPLQRWCATCQSHFSGDLIEHRRTKEHKLSKHSSQPFCTMCKRHFRTPRKFVEHMKSREHKQRVEELREEGEPELLDELITVDAVGCFKGEDDYEEESSEEEEDWVAAGQSAHRSVALEDMRNDEEYDPDTQYGSSFVVPVAGFLCRICHKFYHFESTALQSHCRSLTHFQNLQKYRRKRLSEPTQKDPQKGSRGSGLPPDNPSEQEDPVEEAEQEGAPLTEAVENTGGPVFDSSSASLESQRTHTQKSTPATTPRSKASQSRDTAKPTRPEPGPGPRQTQSSHGSDSVRVTGAKRSFSVLLGKNLSQDSGPQDSERGNRVVGNGVGGRGAHSGTGPGSCDMEETEGRPAETNLQHPEQDQRQPNSIRSQRHSATRRTSTRTSKRL